MEAALGRISLEHEHNVELLFDRGAHLAQAVARGEVACVSFHITSRKQLAKAKCLRLNISYHLAQEAARGEVACAFLAYEGWSADTQLSL